MKDHKWWHPNYTCKTLVNLFISMLALYVHLRTETYISLDKQVPKFTAEMGELNSTQTPLLLAPRFEPVPARL